MLALLNSKLFEFIIRNISTALRGGFYSYENKYIRHLPIKSIQHNVKSEEVSFKLLESLSTQMVSAKAQLLKACTESDKNYLERKCEALDNQIDKLVYELYGLTEEEIKIVEGVK